MNGVMSILRQLKKVTLEDEDELEPLISGISHYLHDISLTGNDEEKIILDVYSKLKQQHKETKKQHQLLSNK